MPWTDAARHDRFLGYLEARIRAKRAEYAQPDTLRAAAAFLKQKSQEMRAICRTYREQFLDARAESH